MNQLDEMSREELVDEVLRLRGEIAAMNELAAKFEDRSAELNPRVDELDRTVAKLEKANAMLKIAREQAILKAGGLH